VPSRAVGRADDNRLTHLVRLKTPRPSRQSRGGKLHRYRDTSGAPPGRAALIVGRSWSRLGPDDPGSTARTTAGCRRIAGNGGRVSRSQCCNLSAAGYPSGGPVEIEQRLARKEDRVVYSAHLNLEDYASLLVHLAQDSETYLGILEWRSLLPFRQQRQTAIVDRHTPLVSLVDGLGLRIPDWRKLRVFDLLIFYTDGSILYAKLGSGDSLQVVRGGADSSAVRIILNASEVLKPARRRWRREVILPIFLMVLLLGLRDRIPGWVVIPLVLVDTLYFNKKAGGELRPREDWIRFSWRFLEFGKAEIKQVLIALVFLVVGIVIGH